MPRAIRERFCLGNSGSFFQIFDIFKISFCGSGSTASVEINRNHNVRICRRNRSIFYRNIQSIPLARRNSARPVAFFVNRINFGCVDIGVYGDILLPIVCNRIRRSTRHPYGKSLNIAFYKEIDFNPVISVLEERVGSFVIARSNAIERYTAFAVIEMSIGIFPASRIFAARLILYRIQIAAVVIVASKQAVDVICEIQIPNVSNRRFICRSAVGTNRYVYVTRFGIRITNGNIYGIPGVCL